MSQWRPAEDPDPLSGAVCLPTCFSQRAYSMLVTDRRGQYHLSRDQDSFCLVAVGPPPIGIAAAPPGCRIYRAHRNSLSVAFSFQPLDSGPRPFALKRAYADVDVEAPTIFRPQRPASQLLAPPPTPVTSSSSAGTAVALKPWAACWFALRADVATIAAFVAAHAAFGKCAGHESTLLLVFSGAEVAHSRGVDGEVWPVPVRLRISCASGEIEVGESEFLGLRSPEAARSDPVGARMFWDAVFQRLSRERGVHGDFVLRTPLAMWTALDGLFRLRSGDGDLLVPESEAWCTVDLRDRTLCVQPVADSASSSSSRSSGRPRPAHYRATCTL